MAKPAQAIPAYQKAVDLSPPRPQLRLALAVAQLATEDARLAPAGAANLKAASLIENDDVFTWYETAQAYAISRMSRWRTFRPPRPITAPARCAQAAIFAIRARRELTQGTPDWERANDIISVARRGRSRRQ